MPIDQKALGEFIGTVRGDEAAYAASAARAERMRRVLAANASGDQLPSAIARVRAVGEKPGSNPFMDTRTADMLRGLISDDEVHSFLHGEGGPDVGLQKIAALIDSRLQKMGVNERVRGAFLGEVMDKFEARLGRKE